MTTILKWSGDGLTGSSTNRNFTGQTGTGDIGTFSATHNSTAGVRVFSPAFTIRTSPSSNNPVLRVDGSLSAQNIARCTPTTANQNTPHSGRFYMYASSAESSWSASILYSFAGAFNSGNATIFRLASFGSSTNALKLRIIGPNNGSVTSSNTFSVNTWNRFEWRLQKVSTDYIIDVSIYSGDTNTLVDQLTSYTLVPSGGWTDDNYKIDQIRLGDLNSTTLMPVVYYDDLEVRDTYEWVGAYGSSGASTWTPKAIII